MSKVFNSAGRASALPEWLRGIRKFIPVIVTEDDIGSSWVMNAYLQKRLKQQKKKYKGYTITPVVSMSISTLERSMKALTELPFEAILEDRMQGDKQLTLPFEAASKYVQRGVAGKLSVHMEVLQRLSDEVIKKYEVKDRSHSAAGERWLVVGILLARPSDGSS